MWRRSRSGVKLENQIYRPCPLWFLTKFLATSEEPQVQTLAFLMPSSYYPPPPLSRPLSSGVILWLS